MFNWRKKSENPAKTQRFRGATFAKALYEIGNDIHKSNDEFVKEIGAAKIVRSGTSDIEALEQTATMIVGQRFHGMMIEHRNDYFNGDDRDSVPSSVALVIVQIMAHEIASALASEGYELSANFQANASASAVLNYLRFYPEPFQKQVLSQSHKFIESLSKAEATMPNVAEMNQGIRTLTIASISGGERIDDQTRKIDDAFCATFRSLLAAIEH